MAVERTDMAVRKERPGRHVVYGLAETSPGSQAPVYELAHALAEVVLGRTVGAALEHACAVECAAVVLVVVPWKIEMGACSLEVGEHHLKSIRHAGRVDVACVGPEKIDAEAECEVVGLVVTDGMGPMEWQQEAIQARGLIECSEPPVLAVGGLAR